jgi:AP-2 complex subunit mu-1
VSDNVNLPFRLIPAVQEEGRARVTINLKLSAQFSYKLFAENVVIKVPVPNNTARCKVKVGAGRAKYEPEQRAIVWRIKRFAGMTESTFSADVELTPSIREKAWSRPPIQVCVHCILASDCCCVTYVLMLAKRCKTVCYIRLQPTGGLLRVA